MLFVELLRSFGDSRLTHEPPATSGSPSKTCLRPSRCWRWSADTSCTPPMWSASL